MSLEKILQYVDLGRISHSDAIHFQEEIYQQRKQGLIPDTILFIEYPSLITKGKNNAWNKINCSQEELENLNIPIMQEDRGGGTAYLGPGQLVVYSILSLKQHQTNPFNYQRKIEEVAEHCAIELGFPVHYETEELSIDTEEGKKGKKYQTVWYKHQGKNHKFFSQGHRIPDKDITKFGIVFYVTSESKKHMHLVNQCGFDNEQIGIISLEEITGRKISLEEMKKLVLQSMQEVFGYSKVMEGERQYATA